MNRQPTDVRDVASPSPSTASGWFNRFLQNDISTLPPEEVIDWADWSADPQNLEDFRRVKHAWRGLGPVLARTSRPTEARGQSLRHLLARYCSGPAPHCAIAKFHVAAQDRALP